MDISLIMDICIALLLMVTILYCALLMRKLGNLRSAQGELRGIIKGFGEAILKAETSIIELKRVGEQAAQALDEKIDDRRKDLESQVAKATELANDLEFMTDAGNKLADRLENAISSARSSVSTVSEGSGPIQPVSEKAKVQQAGDPEVSRKTALPEADRWDDIEEGEDDPDMMDEIGGRSEVERDLLQALRQSK